jgi:hypothetical protein
LYVKQKKKTILNAFFALRIEMKKKKNVSRERW